MAQPKPMIPAKESHSPWSARENPAQDLGYPVNPVNVDEGRGDLTSTRWNTQTINTWRRSSFFFCKRIWELRQRTQNLHKKRQRPLCRYGECSCPRQWKQPVILDQIIWGTWKSTRKRTLKKFRVYQYHTEIDIGAFWRDSECAYDWKCISLMDEIDIASWSSDPVDKSKSTC